MMSSALVVNALLGAAVFLAVVGGLALSIHPRLVLALNPPDGALLYTLENADEISSSELIAPTPDQTHVLTEAENYRRTIDVVLKKWIQQDDGLVFGGQSILRKHP